MAVDANQHAYATVTSQPLAAMPGQPSRWRRCLASPAVGALELLEPVRPRGLTTEHVQVNGRGAVARATVATAAYYLPTDLPTCLPTYLPTDPPTD